MKARSDASSLAGQRIVVTRASEDALDLVQALQSRGAQPIEIPTLQFFPPSDAEGFDRAVRGLNDFDWVVLTSVHGVRAAIQRIEALGISRPVSPRVRWATVGPATQRELEAQGIPSDFVPSSFLTERLGQELPDVEGKRVLLLRAQVASAALPKILRQRGAFVEDVATYRTQQNPEAKTAARNLSVPPSPHWILFTSPSTVENFVELLDAATLQRLQEQTPAACIGPVTAQAAQFRGFQVRAQAHEHTIPGLLVALEEVTRPA